MGLISKYRQITSIYKIGPLKLTGRFWHLVSSNPRFLAWKIGYLLKSRSAEANLKPDNTQAVLVVLHQNPFKAVGGVERETISLLRHLTAKHPGHALLVYYFDNATSAPELAVIKTSLRHVYRFTSPALNKIRNSFNIKAAVFEHLINHPLEDIFQIEAPSLLFVHDFYYLFKVPHPATLDLQVPDDLRQWWHDLSQRPNLHIVFNSEFTLDAYRQKLDIPSDKVVISYPI